MATSKGTVTITVRGLPGAHLLVAILYPILGKRLVYWLLTWLVWYRVEKGPWHRVKGVSSDC